MKTDNDRPYTAEDFSACNISKINAIDLSDPNSIAAINSINLPRSNTKTPKEQIIELITGITIEQWEENNWKLENLIKHK